MTVHSPVGPLTLRASGARIVGIEFGQGDEAGENAGLLGRTAAQLGEYFAGARSEFDLPLAPPTDGLLGDVLAALARIPYGRTASYKDLTLAAGYEVSRVRDVGAALGRNPLVIVLPCHRVIGSDGSLVGFGGGLGRKRALLDLEAPQLRLTREGAGAAQAPRQ